jgi:hypothetical protein
MYVQMPQMDKASVLEDAIEYILQLQQLERQLLAELALLEAAAGAHHLVLGTPMPSAGAGRRRPREPRRRVADEADEAEPVLLVPGGVPPATVPLRRRSTLCRCVRNNQLINHVKFTRCRDGELTE